MKLLLITLCITAAATFTPLLATEISPATRPDTPSATITPDAKPLLEQIARAYGDLKALDLTGTISVVTAINGEIPEKNSLQFTSTFSAPNRFRHEAANDVLIGSTGTQLYTYRADRNAYTLADAPKDRVRSSDLPRDLATVLGSQNPSLLLAMAKNAAEELTDEVGLVSTTRDTDVDGVSCPTLKLILNDKSVMLAAFDPDTHLMRQATTDFTQSLKKRRPDLGSVVVTTTYSKVNVHGPAKEEQFAWTPPAGAIDADAAAAAHPLNAVDASALEGKPAPDFKLPGLDGKTVSLASLKGKVVVIDFWATWCPPCRASLPHLDELYKSEKEHGVQIFAVDLQEEQKEVEQFIQQTKLGVPVLLDREGKVAATYGVTGIPQTVVIDKTGKVQKIFIGFGPGSPEQLQKAVDTAKKGT